MTIQSYWPNFGIVNPIRRTVMHARVHRFARFSLLPISPFHAPLWKILFGWKPSLESFLESCVWLVTDLVTSLKHGYRPSGYLIQLHALVQAGTDKAVYVVVQGFGSGDVAVDAQPLFPSYRYSYQCARTDFLLATTWQPAFWQLVFRWIPQWIPILDTALWGATTPCNQQL